MALERRPLLGCCGWDCRRGEAEAAVGSSGSVGLADPSGEGDDKEAAVVAAAAEDLSLLEMLALRGKPKGGMTLAAVAGLWRGEGVLKGKVVTLTRGV